MEATVAVNYILSYLYNKLPRRRVDMFGEMLESFLQNNLEKFWITQFKKSEQTTATFGGLQSLFCYSLNAGINTHQVEPLIHQVAAACLIDIYEILSYFPDNLILFIEPGKVQYQLGYSEPIVDIWKSEQRKYQIFELLKQGVLQPPGLEPQTHIQEQEIVGSYEKMSLASSGGLPYSNTFGWPPTTCGPQIVQVSSEGCFIQKSSSTPNFTAASFAQTKFGSTKLKSQLKRTSRISSYLAQQRSNVATVTTLTPLEMTNAATTVTTISLTTGPMLTSALPVYSSSFFDSPTALLSQRSISLSPCVRLQRGHSPPYSYNVPLILPPFTSTADSSGLSQFQTTTVTQQLTPPSIRLETTATSATIEEHQQQFYWKKTEHD